MKKAYIALSLIGVLAISSIIVVASLLPKENFGGSKEPLSDCVSLMNKKSKFSIEQRDALNNCLINFVNQGYAIDYAKDINELSLEEIGEAYYQLESGIEIDVVKKKIKKIKVSDKEDYDDKVKKDKEDKEKLVKEDIKIKVK